MEDVSRDEASRVKREGRLLGVVGEKERPLPFLETDANWRVEGFCRQKPAAGVELGLVVELDEVVWVVVLLERVVVDVLGILVVVIDVVLAVDVVLVGDVVLAVDVTLVVDVVLAVDVVLVDDVMLVSDVDTVLAVDTVADVLKPVVVTILLVLELEELVGTIEVLESEVITSLVGCDVVDWVVVGCVVADSDFVVITILELDESVEIAEVLEAELAISLVVCNMVDWLLVGWELADSGVVVVFTVSVIDVVGCEFVVSVVDAVGCEVVVSVIDVVDCEIVVCESTVDAAVV